RNGSLHRFNPKDKKYQKMDFKTYNLNLNLQEETTGKTKAEKKRKEMSVMELWHLSQKYKGNTRKYYPALTVFHSRFAIPFACLVFGLLAVPLGIFLPRTGRAYGFVISLIVILIYYILFSLGENLGNLGVIHPMLAMWFPNLFFLLISIYLFKKTKAESSIVFLEKLAWYLEIIKNKIHYLLEGSKPEDPESLASIIWDINNSSKEGLMLRLGIGEKKAEAIIAYRESQGGIKEINELKKVRGISEKTFNHIMENILG
ncbi:MAG: LptF/LptG family permease, partial [Desulfobacterota bacterium]|nr:LptF/LptG family permease [Thermodesulfobacteriota bacterium]